MGWFGFFWTVTKILKKGLQRCCREIEHLLDWKYVRLSIFNCYWASLICEISLSIFLVLSHVFVSISLIEYIFFKMVCHVAHPDWTILYNIKCPNVTQMEPLLMSMSLSIIGWNYFCTLKLKNWFYCEIIGTMALKKNLFEFPIL